MKCSECKHFMKYFAYYPIHPTGWCDISKKQKISYNDCDLFDI